MDISLLISLYNDHVSPLSELDTDMMGVVEAREEQSGSLSTTIIITLHIHVRDRHRFLHGTALGDLIIK